VKGGQAIDWSARGTVSGSDGVPGFFLPRPSFPPSLPPFRPPSVPPSLGTCQEFCGG
jgi:hypothetical protein